MKKESTVIFGSFNKIGFLIRKYAGLQSHQTHLWQIPVIERDEGRDAVFLKLLDQILIIVHPDLVDIPVSWKMKRGIFHLVLISKLNN